MGLQATLTLCLVLILTISNAVRFSTVLAWRHALGEFGYRPGIVASLTASLAGVTLGLLLIWGLWRSKPWAAKLLAAGGAGYSIWFWLERLLLYESSSNLPFLVFLNTALLILVFSTSISLAKEAHERKPKNSKTR